MNNYKKPIIQQTTLLSKRMMKMGQGNSNTTSLNRNIKNPVLGSKRTSRAL